MHFPKHTLPLFSVLTAIFVFGLLSIPESAMYEPRITPTANHEFYSLEHLRQGPDGKTNPAYRTQAFNQIRHRSGRANPIGLQFNFRGPDNVGGRTRSIIEVYKHPEHLLVGSVTGGLFVSTNGGATWEPHRQFQNLENNSSIISCIVQDTANGDIYVGTGNSFDDKIPGYGIYKSTDQGETFHHLAATTPEDRLGFGTAWTTVNRMAIAQNGDVYAATSGGLWVSRDGGESWENPIYLGNTQSTKINMCADVVTTPSGKVIVAFPKGDIHISETGADRSFVLQQGTGLPTSSISRVCLAVAPSDENVIYAAFTESENSYLKGIYKTQNGGNSWKLLLKPFDDFNPYRNSIQGQGYYDAAIAVSPRNPNTIFIGGVQIWRYDGNLTRIANEFGAAPFLDALPFYVHADKHFIYFSPNNEKRMYVTTDGGVSMTENRGKTWQGLNKLYGTSQFYAVAYSSRGNEVLGGTQDNGTLALLNKGELSPNVAVEANGGDGIDVEMSQISRIYFASNPRSQVVRSEDQFPVATLTESDDGSFLTMVRLWETLKDDSSKDSVLFENNTSEEVIAVGDGGKSRFQQTIVPTQPSGEVIRNSIKVVAGTQLLNNNDIAETLTGSGSGSITFNQDGSFDVSVNFSNSPADNQNIIVHYDSRFKANDLLVLNSENLSSNLTQHQFEYRLESALNPGESVTVQDPVQSLLAQSVNNGLGIYRGVLNLHERPELIQIPGISGRVSCAEFTSDGNTLYVGVNAKLYRVSGLKALYTHDDLDQLTIDQLYSTSFGSVSGVSLDPQDDGRIVLTLARYGSQENVVEITDALVGTGTIRVIHGDLPPIPVFDAEIDKNNPNIILLGTEFGIWATSESSSSSVSWSDENIDLTYVPVFDIRQQKLPFEKASNSGVYYIGTFGRGIWETSSLVGIENFAELTDPEAALSDLKVFPNPMADFGTIEYRTNEGSTTTLKIMDMNGRLVKSWEDNATQGKNRSSFSAANLRSGFYFLTVEADKATASAKFIVL